MKRLAGFFPAAALMALLPGVALAAPRVDSGDTAWMLVASALVLLMTPGLAFFYGGMVRGKNVVSTLYQNVIAIGVVGVMWMVIGYSLAFSGGSAFIGDMTHYMLAGVDQTPLDGATIPHMVFMLYQMMFAIITPALITGAFAERVQFRTWLAFLILWSLLVYAPVAHWVWTPGGFLAKKGVLDFAGGYVVHMTAGFSALIAAIAFGKRSSLTSKPYDVGMVMLGTALLWFGWFGFNAGSALGANGLAAQAFANTFISAAVAMLVWTMVDVWKDGKPTAMGGCIGVVAGLVAVTPAAGYVSISSAMLIGVAAGFICNMVARMVKAKYKIDDTLDVFACHGIGGLIGVLAVGLLATKGVNPAGANGFFNGGESLLGAQITGIVVVAVYSMAVTFLILKAISLSLSLRVSSSEESAGLDASQHGEVIHHHD